MNKLKVILFSTTLLQMISAIEKSGSDSAIKKEERIGYGSNPSPPVPQPYPPPGGYYSPSSLQAPGSQTYGFPNPSFPYSTPGQPQPYFNNPTSLPSYNNFPSPQPLNTFPSYPSFPSPSYPYPSPLPTYGAPSFPPPIYGSPSYPSPTYGSPSYPSPTYGSPSYHSPTYGSPSYISPTYGSPSSPSSSNYGSPSYISPTYGSPSSPSSSNYGMPSYQAPSYTSPTASIYGLPAAPSTIPYAPPQAPVSYQNYPLPSTYSPSYSSLPSGLPANMGNNGQFGFYSNYPNSGNVNPYIFSSLPSPFPQQQTIPSGNVMPPVVQPLNTTVSKWFPYLVAVPKPFPIPFPFPLKTESATPVAEVYPVFICEGGASYFECPTGKKIKLTKVFYGRRSTAVCHPDPDATDFENESKYKNTGCNLSSAFSTLQTKCNNQPSCVVSAIPKEFGQDPCSDTIKYVEVSHNCE